MVFSSHVKYLGNQSNYQGFLLHIMLLQFIREIVTIVKTWYKYLNCMYFFCKKRNTFTTHNRSFVILQIYIIQYKYMYIVSNDNTHRLSYIVFFLVKQVTGEWTSYASMLVPRSQMGCLVMDDCLYVIGGKKNILIRISDVRYKRQ